MMLIMFSSTGNLTKEKLLPHLKNGAKKVIVSAPCKNADKTIFMVLTKILLVKMIKLFQQHLVLQIVWRQ